MTRSASPGRNKTVGNVCMFVNRTHRLNRVRDAKSKYGAKSLREISLRVPTEIWGNLPVDSAPFVHMFAVGTGIRAKGKGQKGSGIGQGVREKFAPSDGCRRV